MNQTPWFGKMTWALLGRTRHLDISMWNGRKQIFYQRSVDSESSGFCRVASTCQGSKGYVLKFSSSNGLKKFMACLWALLLLTSDCACAILVR